MLDSDVEVAMAKDRAKDGSPVGAPPSDPFDPYGAMSKPTSVTVQPATAEEVAKIMAARAASNAEIVKARKEAEAREEAENPLPPLVERKPEPEPVPFVPRKYKPDADPLLVASLELFERIHTGNQLLPQAYSCHSAVIAQIALLKKAVCV